MQQASFILMRSVSVEKKRVATRTECSRHFPFVWSVENEKRTPTTRPERNRHLPSLCGPLEGKRRMPTTRTGAPPSSCVMYGKRAENADNANRRLFVFVWSIGGERRMSTTRTGAHSSSCSPLKESGECRRREQALIRLRVMHSRTAENADDANRRSFVFV